MEGGEPESVRLLYRRTAIVSVHHLLFSNRLSSVPKQAVT